VFGLFAFDDLVPSAIVHGALFVFFLLTVVFGLTVVDLAMWLVAIALLVAALARSLRSMGVIADGTLAHTRLSLPTDWVASVKSTFGFAVSGVADSVEATFADSSAPVDGLIYKACAVITLTAFSWAISLYGLMILWLLALAFANGYRLAREQIDSALNTFVQPHVMAATKTALDISNNVSHRGLG
jgi:hypothetical protein